MTRTAAPADAATDSVSQNGYTEVVAPLEAARVELNAAIDALQSGKVTRVAVARLRDAIDELRSAIPRLTIKRSS